MIKLVALDLDGTIVNDRLEISERTRKVLGHLIKNTDVRVVIATGRMFLSAIPFAQILGVREPLVCYQGAMIREFGNGNNLIEHTPIALPLAGEVLALLAEEKFHANLYINDSLFVSHTNDYATSYARMAGVTPIVCESLLDNLTAPPTKIMAIDDERIDLILERLQERFPQKLSYCKSRSNFCEIIDAAASKWNALQTLARRWDIAPEEIMAIGDQGNDLSMISQAGVGVAMGNAPDYVKESANYVTTPIHEDGAVEAIEKFVLGHLPFKDVPHEDSHSKQAVAE